MWSPNTSPYCLSCMSVGQHTSRAHTKLLSLVNRCEGGFSDLWGIHFRAVRRKDGMKWHKGKNTLPSPPPSSFSLRRIGRQWKRALVRVWKDGRIKAEHLKTSDRIMVFITQLIKRTDWLFVNCSVKYDLVRHRWECLSSVETQGWSDFLLRLPCRINLNHVSFPLYWRTSHWGTHFEYCLFVLSVCFSASWLPSFPLLLSAELLFILVLRLPEKLLFLQRWQNERNLMNSISLRLA